MKFEVSTEMTYTAKSAGTVIVNINPLRTPDQVVTNETLTILPYIQAQELVPLAAETRLLRLEIARAGEVKINYRAVADNAYRVRDYQEVPEVLVADLDPAVIPFLYPSRYCQSDRLFRLAKNLFGHIIHPFDKVRSLVDWIHGNVQYQSGFSTASTSAYDTVTEQSGVCRDFAHLGIALCRALTIPARYFTGYAYQLVPQDFHACFEAYLGGEWVLFDATKLVPLNGLVKIATGKDAADTALANIFGEIELSQIQVRCELADEGFEPVWYFPSVYQGLSYR